MPKIQTFPFGLGLRQDNDERLQAPGAPRDIRNLIRTKNGRLETRKGYTALGDTVFTTSGNGAQFDGLFCDLHTFGESLVALGSVTEPKRVSSFFIYTGDSVRGDWILPKLSEVSPVSSVREMLGIAKQTDVTSQDVAAGGGFVCHVISTDTRLLTHIMNAETGATVASNTLTNSSKGRVVWAGDRFLITHVVDSSGNVVLRRFIPASDDNPITINNTLLAAGDPITCTDMIAADDGLSVWFVACRDNTTTEIRGLSNTGTVTFTTSGPAVLGSGASILHDSRSGSEIVVVAIALSTGELNLYRYLPPTTTVDDSELDVISTVRSSAPPCIGQPVLVASSEGDDFLLCSVLVEDNSVAINVDFLTLTFAVRVSTLAPGTSELDKHYKPATKYAHGTGSHYIGLSVDEGIGFTQTALVSHFSTSISATPIISPPAFVFDRLVAADPSPFQLPSIAVDSSTGAIYMPRMVSDGGDDPQARVLVIDADNAERRQTAQLGGCLYISGGVLCAFDSRNVTEAGGFLTRPVMLNLTDFNSTNGSLLPGEIYQGLAIAETSDALGNTVSSSVSAVSEVTIGGSEDAIFADVVPPLTYWAFANGSDTDFAQGGVVSIVFYSTLDTNDGNITFHRASSSETRVVAQSVGLTVVREQADDDLSDEQVVYAQAARGALSGPLEYVCPDPCSTLWASADKILSGGLPNPPEFQESRPLFPGEQCQWSDSIGFYRHVRSALLAVARLDERRILFTSDAIFEADGPGLDDNGIGDIGAPRKLPSEVGIYGGRLAWRSVVEISAGLLFQGLRDQIYLLPRGGVTPVALGFAVQDKLNAYPDITSAVYIPSDQTVRFTCNNEAGTESIVLLLNVRFTEWYTEGPYTGRLLAAAVYLGRHVMLNDSNEVLLQDASHPPAAFISTFWGGGVIHPFGPGLFGRVYGALFYGTFRGNCRIRCVATFDERDTETSEWVDVHGLEDGDQFKHHFTFEQMKCENVMIDFEVTDLQGAATRGLDWTYWALEHDSTGVPDQLGEDQLS